MRKVRLLLVCTVLLLAAVPSFALPLCMECNQYNRCEAIPGAIERCYSGPGYCYTDPFQPCSPPRALSVLSEWKVASVEITRDSISVTAEAEAPAQPEPQKAEAVETK